MKLTQTKHTPGPWKADIDDRRKVGGELNIYISTDYKPGGLCDGSRSIAMITGIARKEPEFQQANRANAELIAQAPDLLHQRDALAEALRGAYVALEKSVHFETGLPFWRKGGDGYAAMLDARAALATLGVQS